METKPGEKTCNKCGGGFFVCPMNHSLGLFLLGVAALIFVFGGRERWNIGWLVFFLAYLLPNVWIRVKKNFGRK
ncbi:MAG TPA: hypothetical protein ENN13_00325 [Candidatus Altiarchaeales archaeon]|nr:hypothetical protein [Candidatus Altiarchaeales archaeon]